jgi:hypothetical protein
MISSAKILIAEQLKNNGQTMTARLANARKT